MKDVTLIVFSPSKVLMSVDGKELNPITMNSIGGKKETLSLLRFMIQEETNVKINKVTSNTPNYEKDGKVYSTYISFVPSLEEFQTNHKTIRAVDYEDLNVSMLRFIDKAISHFTDSRNEIQMEQLGWV